VTGPADRRPNPEELLRHLQADERREQRGQLKVFLGYASRVGKSQRMLHEGVRRKQRGQDVIVAATQPVVPPDVAEILEKLEVIPTVRWMHAGRRYEVIDLPAVFRRHPAACLIDGLAYDNPPGSRNPKRWQDVNELLDRGISVITAVNLQHIEEQQPAVERITGKRATQCIPQAFLAEADEIEVVDAPPEELHPAPVEPDPRRLGELRELALLLAADVVDQQLLGYLGSHGLTPQWGAQERILVCLTPHSDPEMLRSGRRNALRFHGALLAAHVEQAGLSEQDQKLLSEKLEAAREAGAELHTLQSGDFVDAVLELARSQRVTQIFIGHSLRRRGWLTRNPVDRLIDASESFDVRVFPHRGMA
jgi:two-component system, OmpR family, sensor histidine kinase KdpD